MSATWGDPINGKDGVCDDYAPDVLNPDEEDQDVCTSCFHREAAHVEGATCGECGHVESAHQPISGDENDLGGAIACVDCDTDGAFDEETDLYPARIHSFLAVEDDR